MRDGLRHTFGLLLLLTLAACGKPHPAGPGASVPDDEKPVAAGAGSSGSGYGTPDGDALKLRELVEGVSCRWIEGRKFYGGSPTFERLHQLLAFVFDPQMNTRIEDEVFRINVCLSAKPLKQVAENLHQSVTPYSLGDSVQIAIRLGDDVYLDEGAYSKLDDVNRGYLLFHEALHGLIPMTTANRMGKLRDFVAGLRELEREIPSRYGEWLFRTKVDAKIKERYESMRETFTRMKRNAGIIDARTTNNGAPAPYSLLVGRYLAGGDADGLRELFRRGHAEPNQRGGSGDSLFVEMIRTLRHCDAEERTEACRRLPDIVRVYLDAGADPQAIFDNHADLSPLPVWQYLLVSIGPNARTRRLEIAEMVFQHLLKREGRTPEIQTQLDRLAIRLSYGTYLGKALEKAIAWGARLDARDERGHTALLAAASVGAGDGGWFRSPAAYVIAILVGNGADIRARDKEGRGALELLERSKRLDFRSKTDEELYRLCVDLLTRGRDAYPQAWERLRALGWHT